MESDIHQQGGEGEIMAVRQILLLGNENLYKPCITIDAALADKARQVAMDLNDTIDSFRAKYGFGRAIAAPQIDEPYRIIFMKFEDKVEVFINPEMSPVTDETFAMWDDCMSFPGLEVLVKRYKRIRVNYLDLEMKAHTAEMDGDMSELFQHEYDHLDGILAVQRAIDSKSFRINKEKSGTF